MKLLFRRGLAIILAIAMLPVISLAEANGHRKLTLMVYMCGSNLESSYGLASSDIAEMILSKGTTDEVSVLLMTGGTQRWSIGLNPNECQIQELLLGQMRTVWRSEARNMGSNETLSQLLRYGKDHYPADEYALILWDHGGGPLDGLCWDELFSLDNLTLDELKQGIEDADLGQKLSWIGFDACLMGTLEVAGALEPYTDYMIASQETEPAGGWNYEFLGNLANDQTPVDTARRIVDGYMASQVPQGETLTLACLDLRHVREAEDALGDCFASLATNMDADNFITLESQRIQVSAFGQPLRDFGEGGYDLVDLRDLTSHLEGLIEADDALFRALDNLVVYGRSNREGANGVSVYHPCYNKDKYLSHWRENYKRLNVSDRYARYVDAFGRFLMGDVMSDWSNLEVASRPLSKGRQTFEVKLTPQQAKYLSSAQLLVMMSDQHTAEQGKKQYSLIGAFPAVLRDDNVITAEYDGRALFAEGSKRIGPLGYFLGPDGSLVTPVSYVPKEGVLRINSLNGISVITGDSPEVKEYPLGTDTTPNVYYYVSDTPDGADIDHVRIRDTSTGMLSSRVVFSEDNYRGMVLWFPLKDLPEADNRGLLPEYALWDDAAAVYGVTMALPEDWRFSIHHAEQPGNLLWAAFQMTDVQQNTWCTRPVPMENPKLSTVPLQQHVFETQDSVLSVSCTMSHDANKPGFWIDFDLENKGQPRNFYIYDFVLNGTREVHNSDSCYIADPADPYETEVSATGKGSIFVQAQELMGIQKLDTVSFTLRCREGYDSDSMTQEQLTLNLSSLDVRDIAPDLAVLGSADRAGYMWNVLSIDQDYRSVNLLLRIQNQGEGTSRGETAYAVVNESIQMAGNCRIPLPQPGHDLVAPVSISSRNTLRWVSDHFHMGDTYVDIVEYCLPDLLGDTQVNQIDLLIKKPDSEDCLRIPLPLTVPYTPPAELPLPDDLWTVYHNLCEGDTASRPLIQGDTLDVQIDHLLVGLSGVGVLLKVRNLTDNTISLNLDEAQIDGQSVSVGRYGNDNERIIAPGAETSVVYALGTSDSEEESWPRSLSALRLSLRCGDESAVWVGLSAFDGPVEPVFGGTELSADQLLIEVEAPSVQDRPA